LGQGKLVQEKECGELWWVCPDREVHRAGGGRTGKCGKGRGGKDSKGGKRSGRGTTDPPPEVNSEPTQGKGERVLVSQR